MGVGKGSTTWHARQVKGRPRGMRAQVKGRPCGKKGRPRGKRAQVKGRPHGWFSAFAVSGGRR